MKYRMRVTVAAVGLAAVGALAAACGGGSNSSGTASGSGNGGAGGAFQAYVSCLQQNGVTISMPTDRPSGMGGPGGRPSGAPGGMMPSGVRPSGFGGSGFGGGMPGGGGIFEKPSNVSQATWDKAQSVCASQRPSMGPRGGGDNGAAAAYRNCLSNHGVTASAGSLNTADPKVAAAEKACAVLRPSAAPAAS